jgi:hypothetical protein
MQLRTSSCDDSVHFEHENPGFSSRAGFEHAQRSEPRSVDSRGQRVRRASGGNAGLDAQSESTRVLTWRAHHRTCHRAVARDLDGQLPCLNGEAVRAGKFAGYTNTCVLCTNLRHPSIRLIGHRMALISLYDCQYEADTSQAVDTATRHSLIVRHQVQDPGCDRCTRLKY